MKKENNGKIYFFLFLIILFALFFRLYQPDWYNDRQFHPDERWIISHAVPQIKYWGDKPIGLQYGSLPLYILHLQRSFVFWWNSKFPIKDMNAATIGGARIISGLIDTGTIIFIFLIANLLFGNSIALLSAFLLTFTVLHIHAAHFYTVDTFVTFFIAGCIYFCVRIYKFGNISDYILTGIFFGAALASKTAALPVIIVILTAHLLRFFSIKGKTKKAKDERVQSWINFGTTLTVTIIAFFIFMPHAILSFQQFMRDQNYQKSILVTGEGDVPYNRQYLKTTPYLYYIKNLVLYTMGIPYGIIAFLAFGFYVVMLFKKLKEGKLLNPEILLILSFVFPYFLIVGASFAKFNRYMLPLTPFLAIITAKFIYDLQTTLKDKKIAIAIKYIVIVSVIFYSFAFMNVYFQSHPWIQASRWIYNNIPEIKPGSNPPQRTTILNEMWGDDLPVYADGKHIGIYNNLKWNLQEPDSPRKIDELSSVLSQTDYVMMADKRAYGTYQRIPERYPINYFYYKTMLTEPEKLGFKKVYECAVYPSFLGITIKDDDADESFQLYDHPHVYIFKNELYLSQEKLKEILINGEKITKEQFQKKQKGFGNPNIGLKKDKVFAILPDISIFMWYLLVQLLAFAVFPLLKITLKNLKDYGYGLSKIAGIFIFAYINWILVSLNIIKFYQVNLLGLFIIFLLLSGYYYYKNKNEILNFININKRYLLFTEIIFLSCYLFFIFVKFYCPDIHNIKDHGYNGGGEPMGMAYLSAIFNDVKFPPHDPWLAGFTLNYYYWGQLMLATLTKLLGYPPSLTYNLSLSLLFALAFISAFALAYNMTGKYIYAFFGGVLLSFSGNFHTLNFIYEAIITSGGNLQRIIDGIFRFQFIWDPTRIYPSPVITEVPFFSYLYGDLHAHNIVIPIAVLSIAFLYNLIIKNDKVKELSDYFGNSNIERIIYLFFISVLLGIMLPANTWNFPPHLLLTIFVLFMLEYYIVASRIKKIKMDEVVKNSLQGLGNFILISIVVIVLSYLLFLPFHLNFSSPYKATPKLISKMERVSVFVMFKYFSIFFLVIFAFLLFYINKGFEYILQKTGLKKLNWKKISNFEKNISKIFDRIFNNKFVSSRFILFFTLFLISFLISIIIQPTFGFVFFMGAISFWLIFTSKDKKEVFVMILLFISAGIILGTEIYFMGDGRMNTVFKFYMVAWTFLSISVPYILFKMIEEAKKYFIFTPKENIDIKKFILIGVVALLLIFYYLQYIDIKNGTKYMESLYIILIIFSSIFIYFIKDKISKVIFWSIFIFIMIPVLLYPIMSAFIKMKLCSDDFRKPAMIDGIKYIEKMERRPGSIYDFDKYDYGAIKWINEKLDTIEIIVEAPGERMYTGLSRISIFTGMPTIVGWGYQVGQQSGRHSEVNDGYLIANKIYTADIEETKNILKEKNIKYVYFGSIERNLYPQAKEKFEKIGTPVYQNEGAILFKIDNL